MSRSVNVILFFIIVTTGLVTEGVCLFCDDPNDLSIGTCAQLSKDLERALVQDEGNLFRLKRMFLYSPTAAPVLLKVLYNVTFAENFTVAVAAEEVPNCFSPTLNASIELTQKKYYTRMDFIRSLCCVSSHIAVNDASAESFCSFEDISPHAQSEKPRS